VQTSFDVIFSGLAMAVLSPLIMLIIVILRLTGEGEVFFARSGWVKIKMYSSYSSLPLCLKTVTI